MTANTMTLTRKGKPNIEITKELLEKSIFIGSVCSTIIGMTHRVFIIEIDNKCFTVAMEIYGQCVNIETKYTSSNGNVIVVPKKSIYYWG